MTGNNREISVVNMSTGAVARWIQLPAGKVVKFGDFDANGYFYTGGVRTDLVIVAPNLTTTNSGFYLTAEILGVRVFGGYVYVTAKNPVGQSPSVGIWRHSISAGGVLGTKELVLDWDGVGEFASRTITGISRSINGTLYIGTDSENPLLFRDPTAGSLDYFYKGIVVPYCKQFCWGRGSYIYMINGNTAAGQDWIVIRIDMGTTSASR
jgi:hypothetical protein